MPIKDQNHAYKLQGEYLSRAMKSLQMLREGKPLPVDALLKDGTGRIAAAKARLDSATKDRDEMVRRMDERIARLADDVKRLQGALDEVQKRAAQENSKPRSRRPTRPS